MPGAVAVFDPYAKTKNAGGVSSKIPSLESILGGGQKSTAKPMTTVQNGQAMVMVGGKFVPQGSPEGQSALGGGSAVGTGVAGGIPPLPGAAGGLTNVAQIDPNVKAAQGAFGDRINKLEGQENAVDPLLQEQIGNLRTRLGSDDTARLKGRAAGSIRGFQAAQQEAAKSRAARTGTGGGAGNAIANAGQRAQAKATADIELAQQGRLDQLVLGGQGIMGAPSQQNLAKQGQVNALYGTQLGNADQAAKLALAEKGLGLESWKAQNDAGYKQALLSQQLQQGQMGLIGDYMKLISAFG